VPRIELFAELWPDLATALERAGWECEATAPVLALDARHFALRPLPTDVVLLREGAPRTLVRDFIHAAEAVFEMPASAENGSEIDVLARDLASGATISAASLVDGRPVSGASLIGVGAEAELAGVWTRAEARRQGRAEAVCRALLGHFFDQGGEVAWLSAGDGHSERLYRRLGFIPVGTQLNYAKLQAAA
jgi:ribosomal protein S18 acetylase RimI-like enzyme